MSLINISSANEPMMTDFFANRTWRVSDKSNSLLLNYAFKRSVNWHHQRL